MRSKDRGWGCLWGCEIGCVIFNELGRKKESK